MKFIVFGGIFVVPPFSENAPNPHLLSFVAAGTSRTFLEQPGYHQAASFSRMALKTL